MASRPPAFLLAPLLALGLALSVACYREASPESGVGAASAPPSSPPSSPAPPPSSARGLAPSLPDARLLAAAKNRMGESVREGRCGPYRLWTDVTAPAVLTTCERIGSSVGGVFAERYGLTPVGVEREGIFLFARSASFRDFAQRTARMPVGYGGFALPSRGLAALYTGGLSRDTFAVHLAHELTHLLERRSLGINLPPWLSEGLADGIGDTATPLGFEPLEDFRGAEALVQRLRHALRQGEARSLPSLMGLERASFDRAPAEGAGGVYDYEQSALLIRYFLAEPERARLFRAFLARVASGEEPTPERLREAMGVGWGELEQGFRAWIEP